MEPRGSLAGAPGASRTLPRLPAPSRGVPVRSRRVCGAQVGVGGRVVLFCLQPEGHDGEHRARAHGGVTVRWEAPAGVSL